MPSNLTIKGVLKKYFKGFILGEMGEVLSSKNVHFSRQI